MAYMLGLPMGIPVYVPCQFCLCYSNNQEEQQCSPYSKTDHSLTL